MASTRPATGERLTCTLNTFMKILMQGRTSPVMGIGFRLHADHPAVGGADGDVILRGKGDAGDVVVGQHHSSGVEGEGGLGDETGGNSHGVDVPLTQPSDAQHLVLAVHAQQAEQLVPGPEEIGPQELVVVPAVPGDVVYPGAGSEVAAGQLFHCLEQHRPMLPHALDLAQLLRRGVQHPGQGAETVDQFVGQGLVSLRGLA